MDEWAFRELQKVEEQHWWFTSRQQILVDVIARLPRTVPRARILDIGCGTGMMLRALEPYGTVQGIDPSPTAVSLASSQRLMVRQGSLPHDLQGVGGRYDLVTLLDVLEHIEDDREALSAVYRLLDSNGAVVCTVPAIPALWSLHDDLAHHKRRYRLYELKQRFEESGFRIHKISYFNTLLLPLALLRRPLQFLWSGSNLLQMPPPGLNRLFGKIFTMEKYYLRKRDFPIGLSLIAIAFRSSADRRSESI